jgi:predicted DNA-binding protein (UPF0251 family)
MISREFERLANQHRLRGDTREACRLVLIKGLSNYAAAKTTGVAKSTIGRALKRVARGVCRACGQSIKQ